MKITKIILLGLLFANLASLNMNTYAANIVTGTTKATATLAASCRLTTAPVEFGNLTQSGANTTPIAATGHLFITCSNNASYVIAQNLGANGNTSVGRRMKGAVTNDLYGYVICKNNVVAGNGNCNAGQFWYDANTMSGVGTGAMQDVPVYGFATPSYISPDSYSDTITTTLTF